ncbi:MAG: DNA repair protein RadA [Dehalococcoidia bacterium]|nr:DNA repair protein RadA [Dehalococcoidia bacterium]
MQKRNRSKSTYVCQQCGAKSPKPSGRCSYCGAWESIVETLERDDKGNRSWTGPGKNSGPSAALELSSISTESHPRVKLPFPEVNRVLGGGLVSGSLVLVGGDPGIGKSTLLLQIAGAIADSGKTAFYVTGEESAHQVRLRAQRLGIGGDKIFILPETNLTAILESLDKAKPALAIIDSIQTTQAEELESTPGSVGQVRECTLRLMQWAKSQNVPVLLAGHVTKDGAIAGPRVLEHMVDVVLYLEGEQSGNFRLLRSVKNRFGSTNEIGIFEMQGSGLVEVENPSAALLSERPASTPGTIVVPTIEGTRPLLVEIQALANPTTYSMPRRTASGLDANRLIMICALLSRRAGLPIGGMDVIANVAGGIRVDEPAVDLGIALAIASSARNAPIAEGMAVFGELGLAGELRSVSSPERRIDEAVSMGFRSVLVPATSKIAKRNGIEILRASSIREAIAITLKHPLNERE